MGGPRFETFPVMIDQNSLAGAGGSEVAEVAVVLMLRGRRKNPFAWQMTEGDSVPGKPTVETHRALEPDLITATEGADTL